MIKLLLCGFIAGIISVVLNSVVIGLIIGIVLLTIFASINVKNVANRKHNIIWYNKQWYKRKAVYIMENVIHSCENCGHCDEDCSVCTEVKQNENNGKDCIFWTEDTTTVKIEIEDKT